MLDQMLAQLEPEIAVCLASLDAPGDADPYWPKWNTHWWKLALLKEMGLIERVPSAVLEAFAAELDSHYLRHFPLLESELPPACDPYRDILCFCALGTAAQILLAGGVPVWERLPWLQSWLARYVLPDGGYNCDEQAYTGSRKSSIVSTAPMLEALLASRPGDFSPDERELLSGGLAYFLAQRLFRRRNGELIDAAWLRPLFPRFYAYDLLRGLNLVTRLALALSQPLPRAVIAEAVDLLSQQAATGQLLPQPWYLGQESTLMPTDGGWVRGHPVQSFSLLAQVSRPEIGALWLSREWGEVQAQLAALESLGLIAPASSV